jgi:hypothetical protein
MSIPPLYKKNHLDKDYTSIGLFRAVKEKFNIEKVFYPGCYVHITPSLIFPDVTYADSFRNTYRFFEDQLTLDFVQKNKTYPQDPRIRFFQQDYHQPFTSLDKEFDLLISQYGGFIGQATKAYLKKGGWLVCNNSHGDASLAALDPDYQLVAVYRRKTDETFSISSKHLEAYFIPKKGSHPTKEEVVKSGRGVAYTKSPSGYLFEKVGE